MKPFASGVLVVSIFSTVCLVSAAPTTCSTSSTTTYPSTAPSCAPTVPIGQNPGPNAKVDGSVFNIDGKAEYFAGKRWHEPMMVHILKLCKARTRGG